VAVIVISAASEREKVISLMGRIPVVSVISAFSALSPYPPFLGSFQSDSLGHTVPIST
jgi:hypothetical protein